MLQGLCSTLDTQEAQVWVWACVRAYASAPGCLPPDTSAVLVLLLCNCSVPLQYARTVRRSYLAPALSPNCQRVPPVPCVAVPPPTSYPCRTEKSAVQAYGAGNHAALGPIFKRTLLFLWLHCLAISGLLLGAPSLLQLLSGDQELADMAHRCVC